MKKLLFLSCLFLLFITGCDVSIENQIEQKFEEYVNENFDDPSSVDEITKVLLVDSFDVKELINSYNYIVNTDTLPEPRYSATELESYVNKNLYKISHLPEKSKADLSQSVKDSYNNMQEIVDFLEENEILMKYLKDSINSYLSKIDTSNCDLFYTYKIKFRVKENENKRLHEYYAIVNAKNGNIKIQDHVLKIKDVPTINGIYYTFDRYYQLWNEYYNLKLNEVKLQNKLMNKLKVLLNTEP